MRKIIDNRIQELKTRINRELVVNFESKVNLSALNEVEKNVYDIFVSYNKVFNVIDEKTKTVYVRNIYFKNIFNKQINYEEDLKLPISEINSSIKDEFIGLRDNLFSKVLERKDIIIKILKKIHITSAFLNKFYTLFNDLVHSDVIEKNDLEEYLRHNTKNKKYLELVISSKLAYLQHDGSLKSSNKFKKILENNKNNYSDAVEEAVYNLIKSNYDYIVYELGLKHIKAYVNIVACMYYLNEIQNLSMAEFKIDSLYEVYCNIFDRVPRVCFKERLNSLIISDVFIRSNNSVRLAVV